MRGVFVFFLVLAVFGRDAICYEITGAVRDVREQPIAEAQVWVIQDHEARTTRTGPSGTFRFSEVRPGPAEFVALQDGFSVGGLAAHLMTPDSVKLVLVEPRELVLRVVDPEFQPISGAQVEEIFVGGLFRVPVGQLGDEGFPSLRTGPEGKVALALLPKGVPVGLRVSHHAFADVFLSFLPPGDEQRTIQMFPGYKLRGRVTNEQGVGVSGAYVTISPRTERIEQLPKEAVADPEGFFVAVVRPGSYFVTASHDAYAVPKPVVVEVQRDEQTLADLVLAEPRLIEGTVLNPDGQPFAGVWVAYLVGETLMRQTPTSEEGKFVFKVTSGEGRVRVIPPDGLMADKTSEAIVRIESEPRVVLDPIRLVALPEITGIVRGPEGQPAADVLISSVNLDPPLWAVPNEKGEFRVRLGRVSFDANVRFRAEHAFRFQRAEFSVDLRSIRAVEVQLRPFEPDLSPNDPTRAANNLQALADKPAPALACSQWLNCEPVELESLRGKVVVLTLWGGFADVGPARDRIEELRALYDLFRPAEDVAFVSVHDSGVEPDLARRYVDWYGVPFPVGFDKEAADTFDVYDVTVLPQTVLIDKQGILRYYDVDGRLLELIKSLRRKP